MAKRWLVGVLLGLSLVLLLGSGCADKDCIPCYPGTVQVLAALPAIPDQYTINFSAQLTDHQLYLASLYKDGMPVGKEVSGQPEAGLATASFFVTCEDPTFVLSTNIPGMGPFSDQVESPFGEWQLAAGVVEDANTEQLPDWRQWLVGWSVAQQCPAGVEFVPEPGTIALLGSGLVGLAGYATLRWRNRK